jgi:tetratricopeptide (TPR) repeat protein
VNRDAVAVDALLQRALALHQRGQLTPAQEIYELILAREPAHFDALHLQGVIASQTGQPARAVELIGRALALRPDNAAAQFNGGAAHQQLGRWEPALVHYDRAVALEPGFAEAYSNRGVVLKDLGRLDAALASCDRAVALRPGFAEAHFNRGVVLYELGRLDAALAAYERAITLRPDYAEAHFNRGIALYDRNQLEPAVASYDRAIACRPGYVLAHVNRGNVLKELGRIDTALASYDRAIALKPDCAAGHFNRSVLDLLTGRFDRGWADFEWRWQNQHRFAIGAGGTRTEPLWLGREPLAGRRILLYAEQGLGDTIQFCRYAKDVAELGATVILEAQTPLLPLLESLQGVSQLVAPGSPIAADYRCPLLSLPLAFSTRLDGVPARIPYLKSSPEKIRFWREKFVDTHKLKVGLVWSGGYRPDQPALWPVNSRRNIPLAKLAALEHAGVEFYSLQKGQPAESELAALKAAGGPEIVDFTGSLADFADTAALIEHLDLVISVDTATAHLAGAVGKPVWMLNRFDTCWRWLLERSDSPWYPTLRLFRQERAGDWDGVVRKVRSELSMLASGHCSARRDSAVAGR